MKKILFFDLETSESYKIHDIGAILDNERYHGTSLEKLFEMVSGADFLCGHNIIHHDLHALKLIEKKDHLQNYPETIDTLFLSPLLFPKRPYHSLVKDYKLVSEELNNPLSDADLTRQLLNDEIEAFSRLPSLIKHVLFSLLGNLEGFRGFFHSIDYTKIPFSSTDLDKVIKEEFKSKICSSGNLITIIEENPQALAYFLSLLHSDNSDSCLPQWVLNTYPQVTDIANNLSGTMCNSPSCYYCTTTFNPITGLKKFFNYDSFRSFSENEGTPLQEQVVRASLNNESFITIFPTGGGKSLAFQLPALMKGEGCSHLTVVISPLQSLMKDQIDVLIERHDIIAAVTLNGLQTPIERSETLEKIEDGRAHILYISPESLRSRTIKKVLMKRTISRFVIDEAHCFSIWGQDFRVDYPFIGKFIHDLQEEKRLLQSIPISCFTATAKRQVIEDIQRYFFEKLGIRLSVYKTDTSRKNLHYRVIEVPDNRKKYQELLRLLSEKGTPTIVYVTRVKTSFKLAEKLVQDGFNALPYNGKMERTEKIENQNSFMNGGTDIIVATTAFGMGVDKDDVKKVIHYEISGSLESYVQEAGRAGRKAEIHADCIILFNENDLNIHFQLLQLGKLNHKEIDQVWRSIKNLSGKHDKISKSAKEIAGNAGWQDDVLDMEMKVKASISALENCGYLERGLNNPRVFADSFKIRNLSEAKQRIREYEGLSVHDVNKLDEILQILVKRSKKEQQVDYLADLVGLELKETMRYINILIETGVLGDKKDLAINVNCSEGAHGSRKILARINDIENKLIQVYKPGKFTLELKSLNEELFKDRKENTKIEEIRSVLRDWKSKELLDYNRISKNPVYLVEFKVQKPKLLEYIHHKHKVEAPVLDYLIQESITQASTVSNTTGRVDFSLLELKEKLAQGLFGYNFTLEELIEILLFMGHTKIIDLVEGFAVYYTALTIDRLEKNNQKRYTQTDYEQLEKYYQNRIEQIHIVGEYAKKMTDDYGSALEFVDDYFLMEYSFFIKKYFPNRKTELTRPLTLEKFNKLITDLSPEQLKVIEDNKSRSIMITAGPGSGKTKVLVHKIASLILMEDVKPEQFLMFAFSRIAALELKNRLKKFLGNATYALDIFTFHGFCFDLQGRIGTIEKSKDVIQETIKGIKDGSFPGERFCSKSILIIDEFQDVGSQELELIELIIDQAETIRSVIVGDDDQNVYEFRGAKVENFKHIIKKYNSNIINLITNYRSCANIVSFSNQFVRQIRNRIKPIPLQSHRKENGTINIYRYNNTNLFEPVVEQIIRDHPSGSCAVLTHTNEESALLHSLLKKNHLESRLIISDNQFSVADLIEIKTFTRFLENNRDTSFDSLNDDLWYTCINKTRKMYSKSENLTLFLNLVSLFEQTYHIKTLSEWTSFIHEINVEDSYIPKKNTILVTTMHKAKGKEFDDVYLMLRDYRISTDEEKRVLYVAITRARNNLSIHTNNGFPAYSDIPYLNYIDKKETYQQPDEIYLQLGHKDVHLGGFKHPAKQSLIKKLYAGKQLFTGEKASALYTDNKHEILYFSKKFSFELDEKWIQKGYIIHSAEARFILVWRDNDEEKDYRIILPVLRLKRVPVEITG